MDFTLRKWQTGDVPSIAEKANNFNIAKNLRNAFPHPYTMADALLFVNECIENEGERQMTRAIEVGGRAVGSIGIFLMNDVYERSGELGYWLAEDYWRRGIMSRAVKQICKEAFAAYDIIRIYAEPFADNAGSRGVLEKAGFTCEGTMRNGIWKNGKVHSYCMYSLLREEADAL